MGFFEAGWAPPDPRQGGFVPLQPPLFNDLIKEDYEGFCTVAHRATIIPTKQRPLKSMSEQDSPLNRALKQLRSSQSQWERARTGSAQMGPLASARRTAARAALIQLVNPSAELQSTPLELPSLPIQTGPQPLLCALIPAESAGGAYTVDVLHAEAEEQAVKVQRLHRLEGAAIALETVEVMSREAGLLALDLSKPTPPFQLEAHRVEESIGAIPANLHEAQLLGVDLGWPILTQQRRFFGPDRNLLATVTLSFPGQRVAFQSAANQERK
ncbi:MAG: UTRA domain-containing protein [Chloroflexi bacterium]|nr:UTRA domain-containing protein [Chloroflexota bacterium]